MPGRWPAAGAPGDLREKLESPLGRAEIRHSEADVGGDHPHQRDVVDVVSLGDHLRAHQDVVIAVAEAGQDGLEMAAAEDRVAVHARDAGFGELLVQLVFDALGAHAHEVQVLALAARAQGGDLGGVVAVVAQQAALAPVVGQGDGAVDALQAIRAACTFRGCALF